MALMDNLLNAATQMLGGNNENGAQGSLTDMAMDLVKQQGGVGNLINQTATRRFGRCSEQLGFQPIQQPACVRQRSAKCFGQRYREPNRAKIRRGCRPSRRFVGKSVARLGR